MTPAEYGRQLAAQEPPLPDDIARAYARILVTVEDEVAA